MSHSDNIDNKVPFNSYNDKFSSLIRPIKIFLPLRPKKNNENDNENDDFVGRERLMEKLFLWLSDKEKETGSYLVTGFRGMGKTSLVNRTIERLVCNIDSRVEQWAKASLVLLVIAIGCFFVSFLMIEGTNIKNWLLGIGIIISVLSVLAFSLSCIRGNPKREVKALCRKTPNRKQFKQLLVNRIARGKRLDVSWKEFSNIKVSVNLGHEVLKERDILGLIATNVRDKYKNYIRSIQPRWVIVLLTIILICVISIGLTYATKCTIRNTILNKTSFYKIRNNNHP